jgi:hypothetical protein
MLATRQRILESCQAAFSYVTKVVSVSGFTVALLLDEEILLRLRQQGLNLLDHRFDSRGGRWSTSTSLRWGSASSFSLTFNNKKLKCDTDGIYPRRKPSLGDAAVDTDDRDVQAACAVRYLAVGDQRFGCVR